MAGREGEGPHGVAPRNQEWLTTLPVSLRTMLIGFGMVVPLLAL
jgi:hypothetical protein